MENSKEDKVDRKFEAAVLVVGTGEVEAIRVKTKHPGVFVEVFKDRRRFNEVGS